ncbi:MAG: hypothetical protein D8M18_07140 [Bacteroidetes bacterium]|nr:hypothetical protein [Bacteroidota bacterium]
MQEFQRLQKHTLEDYQRLAWEIRDPRIIKFIVKQQELGVVDGGMDTTRHGNQQWKRMFVFGAGASAHCLFGKNKKQQYESMMRPPLGYEIFDEAFGETIDNFEGARLSVPLFEARGRDIEGCLEDEWIKLRNAYNPSITARHINLQFYLQTLFHWISADVVRTHYRNNLYSLFVNKLQSYLAGKTERVAMVSFNYETILDEFIEKIFNAPFRTMHDYVDYNKRQILLFKPHGSSNWGWPVRNRQQLNVQNKNLQDSLYEQRTELWDIYYRLLGDFNNMVHNHAWGIEGSHNKHHLGRYTVNKNKIEVIQHNKGYEYFPALLMPYRDKDEFVMHYDHHHALNWFVGDMEELYLIGWKGNEEVFNRLLKNQANRLKKIVIVNPAEKKNKEVSKYLSRHLDLKRYTIEVVDTFEKFVLEEMDKIFAD